MEKTINLFGIRPNGMIICRTDTFGRHPVNVVIEPLTEEQENRIDKSSKYFGSIRFERNDGVVVDAKDIYLYGEIDFENLEDCNLIEKFNLINDEGCWIYSNFDYDKSRFTTIDRHNKCYPTWNPLLWFKYCHCLIGKPKRIIIYKYRKHG